MVNCLKSIGRKRITYENAFPMIYQALLSEGQVNCVENIFVTRDTVNFGMSRKEVIQVI